MTNTWLIQKQKVVRFANNNDLTFEEALDELIMTTVMQSFIKYKQEYDDCMMFEDYLWLMDLDIWVIECNPERYEAIGDIKLSIHIDY